jgi:hypothetical protein
MGCKFAGGTLIAVGWALKKSRKSGRLLGRQRRQMRRPTGSYMAAF